MRIVILSIGALAGLLFAAEPVSAQIVPEATTAPNTAVASAPSSSSAGRGLGLGATRMLTGPLGASVAYDAGIWHLEGLVGIEDPAGPVDTNLFIAARFWFHVHSTSSADLSVGGGVGYFKADNPGPGDDNNIIPIDAGAQLRAFIVSNVALSATVGLGVLAADSEGFALTGQLMGSFGVHYYFF